jgi:hypothetical protein
MGGALLAADNRSLAKPPQDATMQCLPVEAMLDDLVCPACLNSSLSFAGESEGDTAPIRCVDCQHDFARHYEVIDFVLPDHLDETNRGEISGNKVDLEDEAAAFAATQKGVGNPVYMWQMQRNARIVRRLMAPYDSNTVLYALGSGTGFDLKLMLNLRRFSRVYSSDIALTKTAIVPNVLHDFEGQLGLFSCEFSRCPVHRSHGGLGLVFQALHHASDAHQALEQLLDNNFRDLILVEPVTNWFVEILARLGLAMRVEYSGVRPDWMSLRKIRRIALNRNYTMRSVTWWELPPWTYGTRLRSRSWLWRPMCFGVNLFSWLTHAFRFGSMAAVRLSQRD